MVLGAANYFPQIENMKDTYVLKQMTFCSTIQLRGVYTSDNFYDEYVSGNGFIISPSQMR
jgi:hypothetical protein